MSAVGNRWTRYENGQIIEKHPYEPAPSFYTNWPDGVFKSKRVPHFPRWVGVHKTVRFSDQGTYAYTHPGWRCRVLYRIKYPKPRPRLLVERRSTQ